MLRRFAERASASYNTQPDEFIVRNPEPSPAVIITFYVALFLLIFLAGLFQAELGGVAVYALICFLLLGGAAWFNYYITQSNHDLVTATEFQNAMFSSIAHLHSSFILIAKANGTVIYHSDSYTRMFCGTSRRTLTSIDYLLENEELSQESRRAIRTALAENQPTHIRCNLKDEEGGIHKLRLSVKPLPRPSGFFAISGSPLRRRSVDEHMSGTMGVLDPTTLPPIVQQALLTTPMGLCVFDSDGKAMFVHPLVEKWLGYEPNEIVNQPLRLNDLIVPLEDDHAQDALKLGDFEGSLLFRAKDGSMHKGTILQRSMTDPSSGADIGCCAMIEPFNEQELFKKKVELHSTPLTTVAHTADGLDFLLNEAPIGIALINANGDILRYNGAFTAMVQSAVPRGAEPKNLLSLVEEKQRDELRQLVQRALGGSKPHKSSKPFTMSILGEAGKMASLYFSSYKVGVDNHLIAHLIDTTEQKALELKYAHSQKMQAVGQLAGGIAHDFNNLLTAMIGFCDLLLMRHPAGDQSFPDIMQVKQNANRAANLVRQLLAFSRRQTLQPKLFDSTDILAEITDLIRRLIGENIELNMVHGRDLGLVKVDQGQFEQVVINLAVNARDAMSDGGILTIRTSNVSVNSSHPLPRTLISPPDDDPVQPGDYVMVEVLDTGCGIHREIISKIFEPFFSTKEVGSGTGLGLATVYGIVKQTGGHILVESEVGKGTRFVLLFQSFKAEEGVKAKRNEEEEAQPASATRDLTGKSTILLVEDEAPVRAFSSRALSNKGYTVWEADCAEAALDIVKEKGDRIEIIVSDVIMPGLDGPSMVKKIWESYPEVKVIFISGYAEDALAKMEGSDKPYHFLPKPFTLKQLAQKVKEIS